MERKKILVVEDDPLIGAELTSTLTEYGYTVVGPITSGEQVLRDLEGIDPHFILMDINLNGKLDGIETAQTIEKRTNIPLVFLSALNDEATLQRAKLANPYGYLIKPFDAAELRSTIEVTIERFNYERSRTDLHSDRASDENEISYGSIGSNADIADSLSKMKLFHGVPTKSIEALSQTSAIKEFSAGEFLTLEGEVSKGGFVPISGRISVTKTSISGKELIVSLIAPGDIYGLLSLIAPLDGTTSARTQIDSKVIWIQKSEWNYFVGHEPAIYKNICDALATQLKSANILSSSLAHARVEGRIISTLLALLPQIGKSSQKDSKEGRIFITRKELSELTGTTPETAIRVTKALERLGLLDLTRAGIIKIPDTKKLAAAAIQ